MNEQAQAHAAGRRSPPETSHRLRAPRSAVDGLGVTAFMPARVEPRPHPELARIRALYAAGQLEESLRACEALLASGASDAQLLAITGMLAFKLGSTSAAEGFYRRAVEQDESFAEAYFNWGNVLQELGRPAEAAVALRKAVQLRPDLSRAHNNLGSALSQLGEHAEAERSYACAVALSPRAAHLHRNRGTSLRALGQREAALACFSRAVELEPGWSKARQSLATTAMELGQWAVARATCEAWLSLNPGNAEALGLSSIALGELGEAAAASELLDSERLFATVQLEAAPDGGSLRELNEALAQQAREDPSLAVPRTTDPRYHCPTLAISADVAAPPGSAAASLHRWVSARIQSYLRGLREDAASHPFTRGAPLEWQLKSWFAVLDREGQLEPHVHYESYVSAVYYAAVPKEMRGGPQAGYFELSGGPQAFPCRLVREPRAVRPREGLLLVFPSYFYHRTLPFQANEPRISIAFDAVPLAAAAQ
ncbi:MAG: tetratricopeptide repeat protein [Myxococcales bacterium]|nr:MAG: tetratricopeptide repeat protein [Myxococcales bacterium]